MVWPPIRFLPITVSTGMLLYDHILLSLICVFTYILHYCVVLRYLWVVCIQCIQRIHCVYTPPEWKLVHLPWFRPCRWYWRHSQLMTANCLRTCDVFRWARLAHFAILCTLAGVVVVWFQVLCRCHTAIGSWCECLGLLQSLRTAH